MLGHFVHFWIKLKFTFESFILYNDDSISLKIFYLNKFEYVDILLHHCLYGDDLLLYCLWQSVSLGSPAYSDTQKILSYFITFHIPCKSWGIRFLENLNTKIFPVIPRGMSTLAFSKEENDSLAFSDVPQDLSAKVKTVSVQTDSNHDSVIRDLLSGFSEKQVRLLLGVLSQFLWRNNQEIPEDSENLIINGLQKVCENANCIFHGQLLITMGLKRHN